MKKTLLLFTLTLFTTISFAQNKVYFSGTIANCPLSKFEMESIDKPNDINNWPKYSIKNGEFSVAITTNGPAVFECYLKGKRIHFYATPGDSLVLKADYTKLSSTTEFSGRGKEAAQFHTLWKKKFSALHKADRNSIKKTIPKEYLTSRKKLRDSELAFLADYAKENGLEKSTFFNYYKSEFKFSFYSSIANFITAHNEDIQKEGIKPEYASLVTLLDDINYDELAYLETTSSQSFFVTYINNIKYRQAVNEKKLPSPRMDFTFWLERAYKMSAEILPKKAHETYTMSILFEYLDPVSVDRLTSIYDKFIKTCSIENRVKLYTAFTSDKFRKKHTIPSNSIVKTTEEDLEAILSEYKGSIVYVDFWASWCAPCIDEMPWSKEIQGKFEGTDVKFVFLSVDRSEASWKKAIAAYSIPGIHIRATKIKPSGMIQQLTANGIPRYLIVGKDGKILDNDAKRPSDPTLVQELEKLLKN